MAVSELVEAGFEAAIGGSKACARDDWHSFVVGEP